MPSSPFEVELPTPIEQGSDSLQLSLGTLEFEILHPKVDFEQSKRIPFWPIPPLIFVQTADLSTIGAVDLASLVDALEVARGEISRQYREEDSRRLEFSTESCSGIELLHDSGGRFVERTRFCIVDNRLYVLYIHGTDWEVNHGPGARLFGSFRRKAPSGG